MPSTSSELGDALRSDGTLKDVSEIVWYFDADDSDPLPLSGASVDPPEDAAPPDAGPRRTTRVSRPSRRVLEALDADCSSSTNARKRPAAKRKALTVNLDTDRPDRRVARRVEIDSGGEDGDSDKFTTSAPPTEIADDDYESIKAMADNDNLVGLSFLFLSHSSHLQ